MHSNRQSLVSTSSSPGSLMQMRNSDVVKRGCLYVKRPPSSKPVKLRFKTWQKRHLVLLDMLTRDGDPLLVLYNSETAANRPNSVEDISNGGTFDQRRCSINLRNVIYVDAYKDSKSFPHAFIVLRTGKSPVIFGAKTDLEMREWMVAIKLMSDKVVRLRPNITEDGLLTPHRHTVDSKHQPPTRSTLRKDDLVHRSTPLLLDNSSSSSSCKMSAKVLHHSPVASSRDRIQDQTSSESDSKYLVKIQRTEDSALHQLVGNYYMIVTEAGISLRQSSSDKESCVSWSLNDVRKLKSESRTDGFGDLITLVANSRCGEFQGTYTFRITSGVGLIRKVRIFAKNLESKDSSCRRQQMDIAMLKKAASSSLDRLPPSVQDGSSVGGSSACQSLQSLVESSGSSSGSHLDQHDDSFTSSSSGQPHVDFFAGNSYLPIVDDISGVASTKQPLSGIRSMTLSRSMGSIAILAANNRHTAGGFESKVESISLNINPPIPPPRPLHTIGLN